MRLKNILALTNGKLVNDPFVKKFETIVIEAKAVKRGDLFIAFDECMIEEAVLNGAYGIVFDKPTQITDTEISWVKVTSCEDSLKKLLRFTLIEKNVSIYECNEIVLKLSLQVITDPNFIPLYGDIKEIHKQLNSIENESTLLFCPKLCDSTLFTDIKTIPLGFSNSISIMEQTLFETSFIYDNIFYERQPISPFFMPYLEELLYLYKILDVNFRLRKFTPLNHFEAVFVNNKFEIKEFGTSDKVLIFEQNASLIEHEMNFLQKNASWANLIYIIPASTGIEASQNIFIYKNVNKIKEILRANRFNFALIAGADTSILTKPTVNQTQLTLDF